MKRNARILLAGLLAFMALGSMINPAGAATGTSYCNAQTCLMSGNASTGQAFFWMPRATPIRMLCWKGDGQYWNGTAKWFYVEAGVNGSYGRGWVNANQVARQTTVGRC